MQSALEIYPILGISWWGNEKRLLDLLLVLEEGQRHEVVASMPKMEGRMELKNLECSINFDARGDSSCPGKGKRVLSVWWCSSVLYFAGLGFLTWIV